MGKTLGHLVVMMAHRSLSVLTDGELLDLFATTNDGAAFAALVERHGPMVLGVCRRALSNRHDAEDACQATFLVLARKAGSLRKKDSLSCWLHGVASRVAINARRNAALRKRHEAGVEPPSRRCPAEEATWGEIRAALDEELTRLPERYRAPLVLCYLECLTRDEAASRLGVSPGTLHGRLERGRTLLKGKLSRRGLTLSAAVLATLEASAVTPSLAVSTANAAALFASGQPLSVGTNVLALTREILMGMTISKIKVAAVLGVTMLVMGGSLIPMGTAQDAKQAIKVVAAETDEAFIRRLSKDLRETEPTATEVHFFVSSREANKRQKLIDLFIAERKAKKVALQFTDPRDLAADVDLSLGRADGLLDLIVRRAPTAELATLQKEFFKNVQAANGKAEVAKITQAYLEGLQTYLKTHPGGTESADVMRQIVLLYEAQGKKVEAEAWQERLKRLKAEKPTLEFGKPRR